MKKVIISLCMIMGFLQLSFAQNGNGWTKQEKENVALVKEYLEAYSQNDENKVLPLLDPSFVQIKNDRILKYADIKAKMESRPTGEQKYENTFDHIVASGDEVAMRFKTNQKGSPYSYEGLLLYVIKNGKIVEEYGYYESKENK